MATYSSFQNALTSYYNEYVYVDNDGMRRARQVVDEVAEAVFNYLKEKASLPVSRLVPAGSTAEGLKVINPDEFDVEIHVPFDESDIDVIDTGKVPDFVLLRARDKLRISETFCQSVPNLGGAKVISPKSARSHFQSLIQRAVNTISKFTVVLSTLGPAITLNVIYDESKKLAIDFVPVFKRGNDEYVAKPNPRSLKNPEEVVDGIQLSSYWRKSFSHEERSEFSRFPDECVEKKCLKIMKAMKVNFPEQLGQFRSYHFKTAFLQFSKGREPAEKPLSEVFIDFLKYFINCLEIGELPHFFVKGLNLFSEIKPSALENSTNFLKRKIVKGNEGLVSLLIQERKKIK